MHFLVLSFPYSNRAYCQVFAGYNGECVCQGLKNMFEHIGAVPRVIVFDNATGIGRRVNHVLQEAQLFSLFREHYSFDIRFCNPNSGHEKGNVENKVGTIRRNLFVPEQHITDLDHYNRRLLWAGEQDGDKLHYKKGLSIDALFSEDRAAMSPLNPRPFDVVTYRSVRANKYGKVQLDAKHHYATRPEYAEQLLLVALRAQTIDVLTQDHTWLVTHPRQYGPTRTDNANPWGTLTHMRRHPGSWPNSALREAVDSDLRQFIDAQDKRNRRRIFQLMDQLQTTYFTTQELSRAILEAARLDVERFEDVAVLAARIREGGIDRPIADGPDLRAYDALLTMSKEKAAGL